jgi:hypothetical protein
VCRDARLPSSGPFQFRPFFLLSITFIRPRHSPFPVSPLLLLFLIFFFSFLSFSPRARCAFSRARQSRAPWVSRNPGSTGESRCGSCPLARPNRLSAALYQIGNWPIHHSCRGRYCDSRSRGWTPCSKPSKVNYESRLARNVALYDIGNFLLPLAPLLHSLT